MIHINTRSWGFKAVATVVLIGIALFSLIYLRPIYSSAAHYQRYIDSLDEHKDVVLKFVEGSAGTSALITLFPGDIGTPIAGKVADLSTVFMVILAVISIEKYLLPIFGFVITTVLIPAVCLISIAGCFMHNRTAMMGLVLKLLILAVALGTLVPVSLLTSDLIEFTFHDSIQTVYTKALNSDVELKAVDKQDENVFHKFISSISDAVNDVIDYADTAIAEAKDVLKQYVYATVLLFVTSCAIPILVLAVYLLVLKRVFKLKLDYRAMLEDARLPSRTNLTGRTRDRLRQIPRGQLKE